MDFEPVAVHAAIPGSAFETKQRFRVGDSCGAKTLPREHGDFDFALIEPASVPRRVVDGEAAPDLAANIRTIEVSQ